MWEQLAPAWQACLELAWEAYCDDCFPIGAVVTSADGRFLARGRNRIYERCPPGHGRNGQVLAHAELEALCGVDYDGVDPHTCSLYASIEPCPMCLGTFYMSGLRTLRYACRDPYGGSVNLLGTTWYLRRKPIAVFGPPDPVLEILLMAIAVEQDCTLHGGQLPTNEFYAIWSAAIPQGVELGKRLGQSGQLVAMREKGASIAEVVDQLTGLVK